MKTNQIMIRDDKRFLQRTKDGFFNATNLLNSWNKGKDKTKLMAIYNKLKSTIDFTEQLKKEGIESPSISSTKGTWMHGKLFIDFAMWVSIEFKSVVIDYVLDGLINSRNNAGDYYNEMCATILNTYVEYYGTKPPPAIYSKEAQMIRDFAGVGEKDRNEMTQDELELLTMLQKLNSVLLNKKIGKESRLKQLRIFSEIGMMDNRKLQKIQLKKVKP